MIGPFFRFLSLRQAANPWLHRRLAPRAQCVRLGGGRWLWSASARSWLSPETLARSHRAGPACARWGTATSFVSIWTYMLERPFWWQTQFELVWPVNSKNHEMFQKQGCFGGGPWECPPFSMRQVPDMALLHHEAQFGTTHSWIGTRDSWEEFCLDSEGRLESHR